MREKHPIDERFRALYEAEATPPSEVRESLAGRLDWDRAGRTTMWNRWFLIAAGVALLITGTLYVLDAGSIVRSGNGRTARLEGGPEEMTDGNGPSATVPSSGTTPSIVDGVALKDLPDTEESLSRRKVDGSTPSLDRTASGQVRKATGDHGAEDAGKTTGTRRSSSGEVRARISSARTGLAGTGSSATHDRSVEGSEAEHMADPATAQGSAGHGAEGALITRHHERSMPGPEGVRTASDLYNIRLTRMDVRRSTMDRSSEPLLHPVPHPGPYVLPAGSWVAGITIGVGRMNGTWRADDQQGLTDAENWRGSTLWGLDIGREWRSGWSIRSGLGLAMDRSTFAWEEHEVERFTDVDTTWTTTLYNNTEDLVYTWNIDTMELERPSASSTTRSNNLYGAIRIPLTIGWHSDQRRWRYGAFTGFTVMIPSQRQGSTLHRSPDDAGPTVVDLTDARVNDRFGPRMNMHAGLSRGFHVPVPLPVLAEPMWSLPVPVLSGSRAPWMQGHLFQFRLQHALFASSP